MTATQKVKRRAMEERFRTEIEAMYHDRRSRSVNHRAPRRRGAGEDAVMTALLTNVFAGLALGSTYALVALGFVVIYKSTGVINFAQGGLLALGAYLAYTFANNLALAFGVAILSPARPRPWSAPAWNGWCCGAWSASRRSRSS